MFAGRNFDIADPGETENYGFDFVNDLQPGDSIVGASWSISVASGTDPSPSSHLINTPFLVTPTITSQQVSGLLDGVLYILKCTVTTSSGQKLVLFSRIPCAAPT